MASNNSLTYAKNLMKFVDKSPSPYHTVAAAKELLLSNGFREVHEKDEWNVKLNDKIFVTKNYSTIIALAVGGKFQLGNGFSIIGAHTDSPCLKLKPKSEQISNGYTKLGVETYGGGIWFTWFDRDLTLAGRAIIRDGTNYSHQLVNLVKPVARVPSLAIHLDRTTNDNFAPNKENHMCPVLCTTINQQINKKPDDNVTPIAQTKISTKHPENLMDTIAAQLHVNKEDIVDMELCFADTQPCALGGLNDEFIYAPRLDNLFSCYTSTEALVSTCSSLPDDTNIRVICLYDNEEVGSVSAQGAESAFTEHVLRRVCASLASNNNTNNCQYERSIANSLLVSADQAHACHPNYEDKHEKNHKPLLHQGIVLKINSNQRYASTAITVSILREIARIAEVPLQEFVVRQDMACGSTIGPLISAGMGLATVDVGGPQLSMHSCREMTDTSSPQHAVVLFKKFFELYPQINSAFRQGHQ